MTKFLCLSCGCELSTQREVREILGPDGWPHGPFCERCAKSAEGIPFAQWLDESWAAPADQLGE
jgi:hypothetical protein